MASFLGTCLCWFQLEHLNQSLSKNLITKCFGCRDCCFKCLAGSLRSQTLSCCRWRMWEWIKVVFGCVYRCQFGKCSFFQPCFICVLYLDALLTSETGAFQHSVNKCVSSSDLLWGIQNCLYLVCNQKVRSRIKLLKHKCLVLLRLLQGNSHDFPIVQWFNCQPKIGVVAIVHGQLGQFHISTAYKES